MKLAVILQWTLLPLLTAAFLKSTRPADPLTVEATTGVYIGLRNPVYSTVREFRNIPYAQPPVGKRRWLPPVAVPASKQRFLSQRFPPSCPQYMPGITTIYNSNFSSFMINLDGQPHSAGTIGQTTSEDCLSLAIWTPYNISSDAKLPVAFFVTGGSWKIGGVDVPYQIPAGLVERNQQMIVVTINYRVNIFGFPNAAGLDNQNLGIQDQRMALEWVYANIAAFGGDRDRIVAWGQSAGAVAVDVLGFAFHEDPLAYGFFMESGTAMADFTSKDKSHSNFTFVARNVGCDFADDPASELECMRTVPAAQLMNFVGQYGDNATTANNASIIPPMSFVPVADEQLVYANYSERAAKGLMAKGPALISTCANEIATLINYPKDGAPNQTAIDKQTVSTFICMTSNTTSMRAANGLTTYRAQYAGNFSNITPLWWMGASHSSDVPMWFGSYDLKGASGDFQTQVAQTMQDYLFAFLVDPENGLREKGWLPHAGASTTDGLLLRFAADRKVVQNASSFAVDSACFDHAPYNSSP